MVLVMVTYYIDDSLLSPYTMWKLYKDIKYENIVLCRYIKKKKINYSNKYNYSIAIYNISI